MSSSSESISPSILKGSTSSQKFEHEETTEILLSQPLKQENGRCFGLCGKNTKKMQLPTEGTETKGRMAAIKERYNKLTPNQKRMVKAAVVILAIAAVLGLGLLAMHFTVGIQAGFQTAGHWISNTAVPFLKKFLAQHITVGQGLAYIAAPIVGGAIVTAIAVKLVKMGIEKRKKMKLNRQEILVEDKPETKGSKCKNPFAGWKNPFKNISNPFAGLCKPKTSQYEEIK